MKRFIKPFLMIMLLATFTVEAQSRIVKARVLSSVDSIPIEFATVRLLDADSISVASALTDKTGTFVMESGVDSGRMLDISSVGCRSRIVSLPCDSVLYLETSNELAEVEIRSSKRYVKVTPRGLIISMQGNPIAKLGAASEALKQLPMIDGSTGNINVLGHGSPLIYINNRLVRSSSELSMLPAESISNVEIITNPSSKYGTDISSVVIIRTKKVNEGFHSVVNGNVSVGEAVSASGNINANYHTENGITIFGDFSYNTSGFKQRRYYGEHFYRPENPAQILFTETNGNAKGRTRSLTTDAGINYDFGKNSIGGKYSFLRTPASRFTDNALTSTDAIKELMSISSQSGVYSQSSMHHVNIFGDFYIPANIGLRVDADYLYSAKNSTSTVYETERATNIENGNDTHSSLWTTKVVLSRNVKNTDLEIGADLSKTSNDQIFTSESSDNSDFLVPGRDKVVQDLYAGFASFDWTPNSIWNVYGGVRWESTQTDYRQNGLKRVDLSRNYGNLLPNLGVSFNSKARMTLYYRASVYRPSYQSLDNNYIYVTPTLWETGNPELKSARVHKIGLNLNFRKFMLQCSFYVNKDNVGVVYYWDVEKRINVTRPVNLPDYNSFQMVAVQQLDFGFWHPTLQGVFYLQNLEYGTPVRKYDRPMYTLSLNNRFDILGGVYAYLNIFGLGTGNQGVIYSHGTWQASVTLNKTWKNWTFTLSSNDILGTWRQPFDTNTNSIDYSSMRKGGSQYVSLSVRYTLNSAKGRYKGKTSRQDEIDRL